MSSETCTNTTWRHGAKPVIGLIGAIGAGKSTAARCFATFGGQMIDADALGHEALTQPEIIQEAVARWGESVRKPDGSLDRRAIARIVFADAKERSHLEAIVFPHIRNRCVEEIQQGMANPAISFVVLDAAVMLEAGWDNVADRLVYIDAPRAIRLARLGQRSGWSESDLEAREAAQWPTEIKKSRADRVIINDASPEALRQQIASLLNEWSIMCAPQSTHEAFRGVAASNTC